MEIDEKTAEEKSSTHETKSNLDTVTLAGGHRETRRKTESPQLLEEKKIC